MKLNVGLWIYQNGIRVDKAKGKISINKQNGAFEGLLDKTHFITGTLSKDGIVFLELTRNGVKIKFVKKQEPSIVKNVYALKGENYFEAIFKIDVSKEFRLLDHYLQNS